MFFPMHEHMYAGIHVCQHRGLELKHFLEDGMEVRLL